MNMRGQVQFVPVIIGLVVLLLIGFTMSTVLGNAASLSTSGYNTSNSNISASNGVLIQLYPMLFIIILIAIIVGVIMMAFGRK
jgi:hypothetical protein